jgi:hypothetical protein
MDERPNPKKFVPDPQPRGETSNGALVAAAVLVFAFFALLAFWFLQ